MESSKKLFYIVNAQLPTFSPSGSSFNGLLSSKGVMVWRERSHAEDYVREKLDTNKFGIVGSTESLLFECNELLSRSVLSLDYQD